MASGGFEWRHVDYHDSEIWNVFMFQLLISGEDFTGDLFTPMFIFEFMNSDPVLMPTIQDIEMYESFTFFIHSERLIFTHSRTTNINIHTCNLSIFYLMFSVNNCLDARSRTAHCWFRSSAHSGESTLTLDSNGSCSVWNTLVIGYKYRISISATGNVVDKQLCILCAG